MIVKTLLGVCRLSDASVVLDASGAPWQVESWVSVADGEPVRERWWFTVGVQTPATDEEVWARGPLRVVRPVARRAA